MKNLRHTFIITALALTAGAALGKGGATQTIVEEETQANQPEPLVLLLRQAEEQNNEVTEAPAEITVSDTLSNENEPGMAGLNDLFEGYPTPPLTTRQDMLTWLRGWSGRYGIALPLLISMLGVKWGPQILLSFWVMKMEIIGRFDQ